MPPVHVSSEIGQLRSVLVHSPGPELLAVTPSNRADYLYDDIIEAEAAQREHRRFISVVERFAKVYQVRSLLAETLGTPQSRELLIRETMDIVPSEPLARDIGELDASALVQMLIEGRDEPPGPIARALNEPGHVLPPLPNLFFTRDSCVVVGDHVLIGSMRYAIRWTEAIIMKARRVNYTIEGGDIHPLRRDLVVIGFSERSSPAAIDQLASTLFDETEVRDVVVVVMPKEHNAIHLDMIFTQVDRELCAVFPPHFVGPERLPVLHWRKGEKTIHEQPNIFAALANCGMPLEPVFCGGDRRTLQEREQWASGCNFIAMRPGVILSYQRNEATLHELRRMGFRGPVYFVDHHHAHAASTFLVSAH